MRPWPVVLCALLGGSLLSPIHAQAPPLPSGHIDVVSGLAFRPGDAELFSVGLDGTSKSWNVDKGEVRYSVSSDPKRPKSPGLWGVAVSPVGKLFATAGKDGWIRIYSTDDGAAKFEIKAHADAVSAVAFNKTGKLLASASRDNFVKIWSISSQGELKLERTIKGHSDAVWDVKFAPEGDRLASASSDTTVKLWNAATGELEHTLSGHMQTVWSVSFSGDGKILASGSSDQTVRVWDAPRGKPIHAVNANTQVSAVSISPDGKLLAVSQAGATLDALGNPTSARSRPR